MMLKSFIFLTITVVILSNIVYTSALPGDAELVLDTVYLEPTNPQIGDIITINADVYNSGIVNTDSLSSIITVAFL